MSERTVWVALATFLLWLLLTDGLDAVAFCILGIQIGVGLSRVSASKSAARQTNEGLH